jgi:predicted metalloprotease
VPKPSQDEMIKNLIRDYPAELRIICLEETYLLFRYCLIRLKDHDARRYRETKNRFIAVLRSAMKYEIGEKIALAVEFIQNYGYLESDIRKVEKTSQYLNYSLKSAARKKSVYSKALRIRRRRTCQS